ncbi:FAD:protein FMN transferase [Neochlamydia sp. AcF65]|uniref:FAD:protein FMN transferase n=2 Tax=unclassified Neochlamydia TaxID=2643326 RepID=UPI001BD8A262|nr:FAD:protein FMN transferase [Neochlamydia sp. AcF65]MBS4165922.1 FAD:protein FMN transferase [Neochlamydia sp. AcF65]MBS4170565.1 FAD:protein FMN transferase [Neochlamydia sp. AcF95]
MLKMKMEVGYYTKGKLKKYYAFSQFFILIFLLYACSNFTYEKLTLFSGSEMTINYRILIGHPLTASEKALVSNIIRNTFEEVNHIYNKWNPSSELSCLNRLKAGTVVSISAELEQLLNLTEKIVLLSEGRFDPTIEPLQALWKKHLEQGQIPSEGEILSVATKIGWNKIHFGQGKFYKDLDDIQIDLGGIAKGYCVDLLTDRLYEAGYTNLFVEWGGEIKTSGKHPQGRPWNIFISRLGNNNPENAIAKVSLRNQAIATSGDYFQSWTIETKKGDTAYPTITYFHIFDPARLTPLTITRENVASASVLAPSCALADGLATTALMFRSKKEAQRWADKITNDYPEIVFWIVSHQDLNE